MTYKCVEVLLLVSALPLFACATGQILTSVNVIGFHPRYTHFKHFYNETASWAKLENVINMTIPENMTICSTVSRDDAMKATFFTLMGQNQTTPFLSAYLYNSDTESLTSNLGYMFGGQNWRYAKGIPIVYPNEWVHSCMALTLTNGTNSTFAHINWVVKGTLVANETQEVDDNKPQSLTERLIIGKLSKNCTAACTVSQLCICMYWGHSCLEAREFWAPKIILF